MSALLTAEKALLLASLLFYFAGAVQGLVDLFKAQRGRPRAVVLAVLAGFALQSGLILWRWRRLGAFPLGHHALEALVFLVWGVVAIYLALRWRTRTPALSAFVLPVVVVFYAGVFLSVETEPARPDRARLADHWVKSHVVTAMLSYGTFIVASVLGVMYLVQERQLRARRMTRLLGRLPPIQTLEDLACKAVLVGFPLLTYSLAMGGLRMALLPKGGKFATDPKVISAAAMWLFYAAFLLARRVHWNTGRKVAWLSIAGFAGVLFTYVVAGLVLGGAHPFRG